MCLTTSFAIKFYSAKVKGRFFRLLFVETEVEAVVMEVEAEAVEGLAASKSLNCTRLVGLLSTEWGFLTE